MTSHWRSWWRPRPVRRRPGPLCWISPVSTATTPAMRTGHRCWRRTRRPASRLRSATAPRCDPWLGLLLWRGTKLTVAPRNPLSLSTMISSIATLAAVVESIRSFPRWSLLWPFHSPRNPTRVIGYSFEWAVGCSSIEGACCRVATTECCPLQRRSPRLDLNFQRFSSRRALLSDYEPSQSISMSFGCIGGSQVDLVTKCK